LPNKQFLGVLGSYDEQFISSLDNVKIEPNSPNIKDVYDKTRILLMPSKYESWGMTASEAMCSGIPIICTETPGLKENCEKAAIYVKDRDNIKEWVTAIIKLDDQKAYNAAARKARARCDEQKSHEKLDKFEHWMREMVNKYR
jgi:glycosyltransferase involved in cell wall biosynthesis